MALTQKRFFQNVCVTGAWLIYSQQLRIQIWKKKKTAELDLTKSRMKPQDEAADDETVNCKHKLQTKSFPPEKNPMHLPKVFFRFWVQ